MMAEIAEIAETNTAKAIEPVETKTVNLSTKITKLTVVNHSYETVSKTCKDLRESNSYVEYGITVAESSLDRALKAGKSVLDSSTLAPITTRAMDNIQYLDKEAGAMVEKIFQSKSDTTKELERNGSVIAKNEDDTIPENESIVFYLGRKLYEVTSFLILLPKNAIVTVLGLLKSSPVITRKRKDRGSVSEEVQNLEPSPVKRKFGDRQSSSDENSDSLVEMLHVRDDYVSEEDSDYKPGEHETDESETELTVSQKEEIAKEIHDLKQDLKDHGIKVAGSCEEEDKVEKDKKQSLRVSTRKTVKEDEGEKDNVGEESLANSNEKAVETKAETSNDDKAEKNVESSSKSRKSTKSPLLGKLLSPSKRKSEKAKAKVEKGSPERSSEKEKSEKSKSEKSKSEKSAEKSKSEKSAEKSKLEKSAEKSKSEKSAERSKSETSPSSVNQPISTVSGPFDIFKSGGKKSKF